MLQQSLVLGSDTQKMMITRDLKKKAQAILYHESGAFVASQILTEALTTKDDAMIDETLQFMAEAHDVDEGNLHGSELLKSMQHNHANHSVRMWIKLLGTLDDTQSASQTTHIERWWKDVDGITTGCDMDSAGTEFINIAQGPISCRSLIAMLTAFGHMPRIKDVTAQLVNTREVLRDLIIHQFGNYVITTMVKQNIEIPRIIDCVKQHFAEIACDDYGNYVMQACLASPHCDQDRASLADEFDRQKKTISAQCRSERFEKLKPVLGNSKTTAKARKATKTQKWQFQ